MIQSKQSEKGLILYRLLLGPFSTKEKANSYKENLKEKYGIGGFIVTLQE